MNRLTKRRHNLSIYCLGRTPTLAVSNMTDKPCGFSTRTRMRLSTGQFPLFLAFSRFLVSWVRLSLFALTNNNFRWGLSERSRQLPTRLINEPNQSRNQHWEWFYLSLEQWQRHPNWNPQRTLVLCAWIDLWVVANLKQLWWWWIEGHWWPKWLWS